MPVRLRASQHTAETLPANCVFVGPGSEFANPFRPGFPSASTPAASMSAEEAVDLFVATLRGPVGRHYAERLAADLRGLDLVCTCPLDAPCHADVLLRLANGSPFACRDIPPQHPVLGRHYSMTHPIMLAAAERLTASEKRRTAERETAFRTWGPRSLAAASKYALAVLGEEAASLSWDVLGILPFDEHLQAVASLDTVEGQHLELYYSGEDGVERLMLRVSCVSCTHQMAEEVTSLEQFGRLLSRTVAWREINGRNGGAR
ncbi:DUF6195 family protein [Streptomyces sp. G45]|uniref:DUF6195 family protein n=1 Tax=Streptomyces sp. G45 TaxID=3406627 RepID=UPI003C27B015